MGKAFCTTTDVLQAVEDHPLEERCKEEVISIIREHEKDIDAMLKMAPYRPPESNYEGEVTNKIMLDYLVPLLQKHEVGPLEGRNLYRRIYQAIGGRNPAFFEIPGGKE